MATADPLLPFGSLRREGRLSEWQPPFVNGPRDLEPVTYRVVAPSRFRQCFIAPQAVQMHSPPSRFPNQDGHVCRRTVQGHLASRLEFTRDSASGTSVPAYFEREFRRYLDRGILAHGFARARCGQCGHDFLIAYSCKGWGVCPACNARRMGETAAHLADHFMPRLPVRQWVLSVPKRLRYYLQSDPAVQTLALYIVLESRSSRVCAGVVPG